MADVKKSKIDKPDTGPFGGVPYGNMTAFKFNLTTNASGVLVASDQDSALVDTDVVMIGVLPKGFLICHAIMIISDAFNATTTFDIGWEYVDGVAGVSVVDDPDYFTNALAASSQSRTDLDNVAVAPVRLEKDAYVTVLVDDADLSAVGVLDVVIWGIAEGKL